MRFAAHAVTAALVLSVVGMMLVIGSVLARGLFLPGVVTIGASMIGYVAAAVLHARDDTTGAA
jgi:hypothetical protein